MNSQVAYCGAESILRLPWPQMARISPRLPFRAFRMRRLMPIAAALFAAVALTGAGQQAPRRMYQAFSEQQKADLDKISAYLNTIHTLRSGFLQVGPDGQ